MGRPRILPELQYWPGRPASAHRPGFQYLRDTEHLIETATAFIQDSLEALSAVGLGSVVVGLSGGLDSAVTLALCRRCVEPQRLVGVFAQSGFDRSDDELKQARRSAAQVDVECRVVNVAGVYQILAGLGGEPPGPFSGINSVTRAIQAGIFAVADSLMACVASTVDRSERLLGRQTEHFYGHFAPLADLYKTEVQAVARALGLPPEIIDQPAGCHEAWLDEEVLGVGYDVIDPILHLLSTERWGTARIASEYEIDREWLDRLAARVMLQPARLRTRYPSSDAYRPLADAPESHASRTAMRTDSPSALCRK